MSTQVVIEFVRKGGASEEALDALADSCLEALNLRARFLAFGPVVSVDYERSALEVECTVCAADGDAESVDSKIERIKAVVREAIVAAEYATSTEQIPVPA